MEKAGNIKIQQRLLTWLMNATLVLSVLAFSGHVSTSKSSSFEPARTELRQNSRANTERIVRFETIHNSASHFALFDQIENFHCCRCQYQHQTEVKLKSNLGHWIINNTQFLIHYFTYNSEESDTDRARG